VIKQKFNSEKIYNLFDILRSESENSSTAYSEPSPLLSDDKLSPDCIDSSEPNENIENDPSTYVPTYMYTPRYSNIQESVGSNIVITWSK